ncbi:galactose ABC transporter substrate-binding protein [Lachnospiraceae bacterium]|nr:galactose ABC transporter substrate-binding protein [Lachnospiraceae bacterium]
MSVGRREALDSCRRTEAGRALFGLLPVFLAVLCLLACGKKAEPSPRKIKVGIAVYDQYDTFISELIQCFDGCVQKRREEMTTVLFNAAKSQQTQDKQVRQMIEDGCDVICVNLVDRTAPTKIIDLAKKHGVPVVFFNRELVEEDLFRWDRLYYVGADAFQSGMLQGKIAAESCRENPQVDRNGDGSIQYVVLEGEVGHQDAIVRTEYCVNTMLNAGLHLEKLGYVLANWNRLQAQTQVSQMIARYGDRIELIMSNNDDMALGAIDAYKEEKIERERWPLIVGIDGTVPGCRAVIDGEMAGTVYNDNRGQAEAMFELVCAIGLQEPMERYRLINGKYIRLPYQKVTKENAETYLNRKQH